MRDQSEQPDHAFPQFEDSRALVHIAFHYVMERLPLLDRVLSAIEGFGFASTDVVVDTNTAEAEAYVAARPRVPNVAVRCSTHPALEDPFLLTWQHRGHMERRLHDYEYFVYLEDDIEVPAAALSRWRTDSASLAPRGYARGFIRVERLPNQPLMCTDLTRPARIRDFRWIGGSCYLHPVVPYQAFWIYSRSQMKEFVAGPCWKDGNHNLGTRERAAVGMAWRTRGRHNHLIPLDDCGCIPLDTCIFHLTANYASDPDSRFASIPLDRYTDIKWPTRACYRLMRWALFR